jgi:hypothetical protein
VILVGGVKMMKGHKRTSLAAGTGTSRLEGSEGSVEEEWV